MGAGIWIFLITYLWLEIQQRLKLWWYSGFALPSSEVHARRADMKRRLQLASSSYLPWGMVQATMK